MIARRGYVQTMRKRYRAAAGRKAKSALPDELVGAAGFDRKCAITLMNQPFSRQAGAGKKRSGRPRAYQHCLSVIEAARQRVSVDLRVVHVPGALEALLAGDGERHDELVPDAARAAGGGADALRDGVWALAQFSLARVAPRLRAAAGGTVLTTPDTAVAELRRRMAARASATKESARRR